MRLLNFKVFAAISVLFASALPAFGAGTPGVEFSAALDRQEITEDESVALKMTIRSEGSNIDLGGVSFNAPDFDLVNEYTSTFVESFYENGTFGVRHRRQITKVLRPKKQGNLEITRIQATINGENHTVPPLRVLVHAGGAGTPPPPGYGGAGGGLRGAGKRAPSRAFFIRAEVDKSRAYKGEQILVSYYLYKRSRIFNLQVDKYPTLGGFLREDLEMPVLNATRPSETVVLDGYPYERELLVRYAAYPLKEGKLAIDAMAVRANYYGSSQDDEDPFRSFFQQLTPLVGTSRSDPLEITVSPLPEEGRPADFSGGVGDFSLAAAVDRYELRANEALTLIVTVEGRGNASAIETPKADWPESVELYESKANAKTGRGGIGKKTFQFMLIPRQPGEITLPGLKFWFFDPQHKEYVSKETEPFQLRVLEALPGQGTSPRVGGPSAPAASPSKKTSSRVQDIRYLKPPSENRPSRIEQVATWTGWLLMLALLGLAGRIGLDRIALPKRSSPKASKEAQSRWRALQQKKDAPWPEVLSAYDSIQAEIYAALDRRYGIGARSYSREELERMLVQERGLKQELWNKVSELIEFSETLRFAISARALSEQEARTQLEGRVREAQALVEKI